MNKPNEKQDDNMQTGAVAHSMHISRMHVPGQGPHVYPQGHCRYRGELLGFV